jgi:hypothetical protein
MTFKVKISLVMKKYWIMEEKLNAFWTSAIEGAD